MTQIIPRHVTESLYMEMPELIINDEPLDKVARKYDVDLEYVQYVKKVFMEQTKAYSEKEQTALALSNMQSKMKVEFANALSKNAKAIARLWEKTVSDAVDIDGMIDDKIAAAKRIAEDAPEDLTVKSVDDLLKLLERKQKLISALVDKLPISKEMMGGKGPVVQINNNVPASDSPKDITHEKADIVSEPVGYVEPPKI